MKPLTMLIIVLCLGALLLGGCDDKEEAEKTTSPGNKVNLLVAVQGQVRLKREGWKDYVPVHFGTLVRSTDLIEVEGSASLLCADLSLKAAPDQGRQPCPVEGGWLEYGGARFESGQRTMPAAIPHILHPRNTLVLDSHPLLRWNDTGASGYTVSIMSGGKEIWSQSGVVDATTRYPDDAPALQPGTDYLLVVQDESTDRASTEDPAKGLGFRLLSAEERATVEERRDEILALGSLDEPARDLALAVYYASLDFEGRGLWGEAWLLLESIAQTQDAPAVHRWTGDVLAAMKLPDEAQAAYGTTSQRAEALGDLECRAAAYAGLWRLKGDKGYLEQALELYEKLGDDAAAEELRKEQ